MSFFKHLGTKASKFQFKIWIENVIGVYASSYSTNEHQTEGIYVMLKRKKKTFRTKIALPETGGHVLMNDCIKFTSTLYQKKQKQNDTNVILPKPFILRVCNNSHDKIRWETTIDLADYASVFGIDSQESFTLQFAYKSKQTDIESMKNIPMQITVRLRIKCAWLKNVDNMSASTDSISTISKMSSSTMHSDLSDFDNYKLYDSLSQKQDITNTKSNQIETSFNNNHQHNYHHILFTALPEDHSIHNTPNKPILSCSLPHVSENNTQHIANDINNIVTLDKKKTSALQAFVNIPPGPPPANLSSDHVSDVSTSELFHKEINAFEYQPTRVPNLSFIISPKHIKKKFDEDMNNNNNVLLLPIVKSDGNNVSFVGNNTNYSGNNSTNTSGFLGNNSVFLENELLRIDEKMNRSLSIMHENNDKNLNNEDNIEHDSDIEDDDDDDGEIEMDIKHVINVICDLCIDNMNILKMEERIWRNLIPRHCAIIFRCFVYWNVFEENKNNTQLILQGYISKVTMNIQNNIKNELEQSYWLLRLTTLIYWLHLFYPQKLISLTGPQKPPQLRRHETFEPIQSPNSTTSEHNDEHLCIINDDISNDNEVQVQIKSENQTTEREENNTSSNDSFGTPESIDIPIERISDKLGEKKEDITMNLQYWFVEKLTNLCHICFDNIIDNTLHKLSRIPYEHVFDENECGEQGSMTMDMIFAVMNSIWFLWEDIQLFTIYRIQICRQILQYSIVRLINNLLIQPQYCTIAGGFRLKVIKSMIADWSQSNRIQNKIFADIMAMLDEVSALLLTCAVAQNGKDLLKLCPSLNAAQINQILNNYNSEATNEPLSAEILTPILEIAASELPRNKSRVSVQNICFVKQTMKAFNVNDYLLPSISLYDIPIPYQISKHSEFKFLMNMDNNNNIVL
eukprot:259919_1